MLDRVMVWTRCRGAKSPFAPWLTWRGRAALALAVTLTLGAARDVSAQTRIEQDTTWDKAKSPLRLDADVVVAAGARLTIAAGVTVELAAGVGITVDGELVARGSKAEPVTFTGAPGSGGPARWGAIVFTAKSKPAVYQGVGVYRSGSILEHAVIEHGTRAVSIAGGAPYVHACTLRHNFVDVAGDTRGGAAMFITRDAKPRVVGNTFDKNEAPRSLEGGALYASDSAPIIQDNRFIDNKGGYGGALATFSVYSPVVGNVFEDNVCKTEGGAASFYSSSPAILNNTVRRNQSWADGGGIHICHDCYPHANPIVMDNTITDNTNTFHVGAAGFGVAFIRVFANNNVHGNKLRGVKPSDFGWYNKVESKYPDWVAKPHIGSNYWGSTDMAAVEKAVFDGKDDPKYQKVTIAVPLAKPVQSPETRVVVTTLKVHYREPGERMPVFLTIYNPGAKREVDLTLMVAYAGLAPLPYRGKLSYPGAVERGQGYRLSLPANSVYFTTLVTPKYADATALGAYGTLFAALHDAASGARIGVVSSARFDLGGASHEVGK